MDNKIKVSAEGKTIIKKENGVVVPEEATEEKLQEIRKSDTLCFDCSNLENCKKVADQEKKSIDKYDFISDGSQVIDEEGNIENFVITNCRDFVKEEKKTGINRSKIVTDFVTGYFNVDTLGEAEKELSKRGVRYK